MNWKNAWRAPLIEAARCGDVKALELLLDAGADVNISVSKFPHNAITAAVHNEHKECVEKLIQRGARVTTEVLRTAMRRPCYDPPCVELLLRGGIHGDPDWTTLLDIAVQYDVHHGFDTGYLELLMKAGADVKNSSSLALRSAAKHNAQDHLYLLAAVGGADVNEEYWPRRGLAPLEFAAHCYSMWHLEHLVDLGADVTRGGDWRPHVVPCNTFKSSLMQEPMSMTQGKTMLAFKQQHWLALS